MHQCVEGTEVFIASRCAHKKEGQLGTVISSALGDSNKECSALQVETSLRDCISLRSSMSSSIGGARM